MPLTTTYSLPYPLPSDPADVASDVEALARATEDAIAGVVGASKHIVPTGTIIEYVSATPPTGWLLCNGGEHLSATYSALSTLLGSTFNASFGAPTAGYFRLPNLQNRAAVGAGGTYSLGAIGGAATHALSVSEMPSHGHDLGPGQSFGTDFGAMDSAFAVFKLAVSTINGGSYQGPYAALATGGNTAHNNMQPYVALHFMIKT